MSINADSGYGYDGLVDYLYIDYIDEVLKTKEEKLKQIKKMYLRDEHAYGRWKRWCMREGELSDIFGTIDNPIEIDESKL